MKLVYFLILFWPIINTFRINEENLNVTDVSITSTIIPKKEKAKRSTELRIPILLKHSNFNICIKISPNITNFFSKWDTKITFSNTSLKPNELDFEFAKGYVENFENSYVDGYIEDECFYGRIIINSTLYYVEKIINHRNFKKTKKSLNNEAVIYSITLINHLFDVGLSNLDRYYNTNRKANICPVVVIIDKSFIKLIANNNVKLAILIVVNSFEKVNSIFRSTDFNNDGIPDNIGFKIQEIVIHPVTHVHKYEKSEINSKFYLYKLLTFPKLKDVCLGVAFTGQQFKEKVIGLSYQATAGIVGGICSTGLSIHFNAIVITYMQGHKKNPQIINDICLGHEIGHTFGSGHDDPKKCKGYIMAAETPTFIGINNFRFSNCSKNEINKIYPSRKFCFEEDKTSFCGNGILEDNEDCDCGSIYDCLFKDQCCMRISEKSTCKLNKLFTCHPSQGLCCTSSCSIRNIKHLGLSCKQFQRKCNGREIDCGINGKCINNTCHSKECFRIGLNECQCPTYNEESLCQTCCEYEGKCLSSIIASKFVVNDKPNSIVTVNEKIQKKTKFDFVEKVCNKNICFSFLFKRFPVHEYCLVNGNLGVCEENYVCTSRIRKYDMLPYKEESHNSGSIMWNLGKFVIFLLAIKSIAI